MEISVFQWYDVYMSYNPKKKEYNQRYVKENIKRIPLDIQKSYYDEILKPAADAAGMSVNGYIKEAIKAFVARGKE